MVLKAIGRRSPSSAASSGGSGVDNSTTTTASGGTITNGRAVRPILIIPGFMSSGLQIESTALKKEWNGKRIWLNLKSLGFEVISRKVGANKSMWLQHMITQKQDDIVNIQPLPGLDGVDYLYPGTLTKMATYVMGPFMEFLDKHGYVRDKNLCAAPWDWRKAPSELPQDFYDNTLDLIEKMYEENSWTPIVIVAHSLGARMAHYLFNYAATYRGLDWLSKHIYSFMPVNGTHVGVPKSIKQIVLVDSSCLDPFLSLQELVVFCRSLTSAPWMYPTILPDGALYHQAYIKPQGLLEIRVSAETLFLPRSDGTASNNGVNTSAAVPSPSFRLLVALQDRDHSNNSTPRVRYVQSPWKQVTKFSNDTFVFTIDHNITTLHDDNIRFQFYLQQKGGQLRFQKEKFMANHHGFFDRLMQCLPSFLAKCLAALYLKLFCCCIVDTLLLLPLDTILGQATKKSKSRTQNSEAGKDGDVSAYTSALKPKHKDQAVAIEVSEPISWNGEDEQCNVRMYPIEDALMYIRRRGKCLGVATEEPEPLQSLDVELKFNPYRNKDGTTKSNTSSHPAGLSSASRLCGPVAEQSTKHIPSASEMIQIISGKHNTNVVQCKGISGYEIFEKEGMDDYLKMIQNVYYDDPIGPLTKSAIEAPPGISRVFAIYGINLPTEVSAVYCRKDSCVSSDKIQNLHWLDDDASVVGSNDGKHDDDHGYIIDGGRILETPNTAAAKSGDGTVPYHCLGIVNHWKEKIEDVQTIELEGAEHRDILSDERFYKHVLEHCRITNETV